jgi:uncharacterized membrane protein YhaH (DUF805 family)
MNYYSLALKKYADFTGRATKKEFTAPTIINIIVILTFNTLSSILEHRRYYLTKENLETLDIFYGLTVLYLILWILPQLALIVRRLHDIGKSGWFILISLLPVIGNIFLIYLMFAKGEEEDNKYGPSPYKTNINRYEETKQDEIIPFS